MKPSSRILVSCDKFIKPGVDFVVHAHRRRWRRRVGLVMVIGPDGASVIVPDEVVEDPDGVLTDVLDSTSYMEVMSKLRRQDCYDESVHNTWHWVAPDA